MPVNPPAACGLSLWQTANLKGSGKEPVRRRGT